jgi:hypothetical protein
MLLVTGEVVTSLTIQGEYMDKNRLKKLAVSSFLLVGSGERDCRPFVD